MWNNKEFCVGIQGSLGAQILPDSPSWQRGCRGCSRIHRTGFGKCSIRGSKLRPRRRPSWTSWQALTRGPYLKKSPIGDTSRKFGSYSTLLNTSNGMRPLLLFPGFFCAFCRKLISPKMAKTHFTQAKTHFTKAKTHFTQHQKLVFQGAKLIFQNWNTKIFSVLHVLFAKVTWQVPKSHL